ncbi:MAG: RAMP superfamily CRISPR-associated protein [candidate division KSB1 bacterium]|nr:RAMP superfamily CRISPR-associated protein [candidate division KSB1 bacterium]
MFKKLNVPAVVLERLVLVSDKLFDHVVNSNLEVRTSTAIDPITGSSKEGALFTYEAVPRAAIFWFNVIYKDPRNFKMNGEPIEYDMNWVIENTERGLRYLEYLGVGGMVTRGMGRMRMLNL